jgi:hypothetical protein
MPRADLRFFLIIAAGFALLLGAERGYNELTDSDCDANCQRVVEQYLQDYPVSMPTAEPGEQIINDVLEGR